MAELSVSKKSIGKYLTETLKESNHKLFVIPEYQRPYSWDVDKCRTLWEDVRDFRKEETTNDSSEYFLGTIVSCAEDYEGINIIDGQQRITSFFLLLRAFYTKLEKMSDNAPDDDELSGLMKQVGACIWDVNPMSQRVTDKSKAHIESKVATERDNGIFRNIIETGQIPKGESHYEENYRYFFSQCDEYARDYPTDWKGLCLFILNQCIILPIECKDLESALTIFHTLNDRGMPLSDADIFKAKLYKLQADDKKEEFTENWKELSLKLDEIGLSVNDIFRYYTHYLRGAQNDKSKEIGLRKFYSDNQYEKLKVPHIMKDLMNLADFWCGLLQKDETCFSLETRKLVHCLQCYPNEYWKYPTTVFYFKHKDDYKEELAGFLKNLLSFLFIKFLENPTVNAIKDSIFQTCIDIYNTGTTNLSYPVMDFENRMNALAMSKITKPMLLLDAYLYDEEQGLIPDNFQIEHIFPQKWDATYFKWSKEEAGKYINKFGNKIPLEWRLNIQASNGFYSKKKDVYNKSEIKEVKALACIADWDKEDIDSRNGDMLKRLKSFFEQNLKSQEQTVEKLLEYTGGPSSAIIEKIINSDTKSSYRFIKDGATQDDYDSPEIAVTMIPKGLLQYGTKVFLADEMIPIIESYLKD